MHDVTQLQHHTEQSSGCGGLFVFRRLLCELTTEPLSEHSK